MEKKNLHWSHLLMHFSILNILILLQLNENILKVYLLRLNLLKYLKEIRMSKVRHQRTVMSLTDGLRGYWEPETGPTVSPQSMMCMCLSVCAPIQSCPALCDLIDESPPGSSFHGIFQARILEWVAISSSRGFSEGRDRTWVSCISCIGRQILYHCTTGELKPKYWERSPSRYGWERRGGSCLLPKVYWAFVYSI